MSNDRSNVARFTVTVHEDEQTGSHPHVVAIHDPDQPDSRKVVWGAESVAEATQVASVTRAALSAAAALDARARDSVR